MKPEKKSVLTKILLIACLIPCISFAQGEGRKQIDLNSGWTIRPAYDVNRNAPRTFVALPHTWNANDGFSGINYSRETMVYECDLAWNSSLEGKRTFLYFEGVNSVATVLVNGRNAGTHYGGYTAFCFEITENIIPEKDAHILVFVSNAFRSDLIPLVGDFNIYGGIHRPVKLLVTDKNCISPLDYASSGVYVKPRSVSASEAKFDVETVLSLKGNTEGLQLRTTIMDANNAVVAQNKTELKNLSGDRVVQEFRLAKPVLWNGKENPYCYRVTAELLKGNQPVDAVTETTGFRYFSVDANEGFFLNGKYLDLYGFGKHEDISGKGSAFSALDYINDMNLVLESGATVLRLTHYPHGKMIYDLADKSGIVLWTEIPFVGPGGYVSPGYIEDADLKRHTRQMLLEMIHQNMNHPSVLFWGLFNELKLDYDSPVSFLKELNALAKKTDPSRLTTAATFGSGDGFIGISDLIGWNQYSGWYDGEPEDVGPFMDKMRAKAGNFPVSVSEYGAGGSIYTHQLPVEKAVPVSNFHPEEWQTVCHEGNWKALAGRKYIWGKYIWNFSDFGSSIRNEGDRPGVNDKGLITYDHQTRKDAFYFYKANWNPEPMVYITSRRFVERTEALTEVKVFSNAARVGLWVNGSFMGEQQPDNFKTARWPEVKLVSGANQIEVKAEVNGLNFSDKCVWTLNGAENN